MTTQWLTASMWMFPLLGLAAGVLAGLLGIGGGLILVAALVWLLPLYGVPAEHAMHAALATSLASIVLTGLASARAHHRRGSVLWRSVVWLVPGLLLGAFAGSRWALGFDGDWLRGGVSLYCGVAAAQLWLDWPRPRAASDDVPQGPGYTAAAGVIGALSSWVGIGGGSMTVPLLVWRGVPMVRAVGTSSACGVAIALASAIGYASPGVMPDMPAGSWGLVHVPAAFGIALASIFAAPWGVRLAHQLPPSTLKRVFAVFLLVVGSALALGR